MNFHLLASIQRQEDQSTETEDVNIQRHRTLSGKRTSVNPFVATTVAVESDQAIRFLGD